MSSFNDEWTSFLLGEGKVDIFTYLQSLQETLDSIKVTSLREQRRIHIAKEHLKHVKRHVNMMLTENEDLKNKLSILEENKDN